MWLTIFYALTVIASGIFALMSLHSALSARAERELLARRVRSLELQAQSFEASIEDLTNIVAKMANSQKMQRVRAATTHATKAESGGEPDVKVDPEAWRAWQNKQLKTGVMN
jgi:gamma-glutamyl:cysteine ligase YbdK (ATP-grasp superfamily)